MFRWLYHTKVFCLVLLSVILLGTSCSTQKNINVHETEDFKIGITNKKLYQEVESWLGTPYKYGGQSKNGVDCSGLVVEIYKKVYEKKLYRSSNDIYNKNCRPIKKNQLREGDLVFFITAKNSKRINHIGLYLNNNQFIHSTTKKGVIITDLSEEYYKNRFVGAGRVILY